MYAINSHANKDEQATNFLTNPSSKCDWTCDFSVNDLSGRTELENVKIFADPPSPQERERDAIILNLNLA